MSFLARRVAAAEGAFFSRSSREAIARLREKAADLLPKPSAPVPPAPSNAPVNSAQEANADVLPEILKHTLPLQQQYDGLLPAAFSPSPSSLASLARSKLSPHRRQRQKHTSILNFLPTLPQASFGPRRWVPPEAEVKILPSTANEANLEVMPTIDDAKAKALVEGYGVIFKAFLVATTTATLGVIAVKSNFNINSLDDVQTKGHEYLQPRAQAIHRGFEPWRQWVQKRKRDEVIVKGQSNTAGATFVQALGWKQGKRE